ncbi:hypothetical protein MCETHM1_00631 [Flavobacteriaceae bacterium]
MNVIYLILVNFMDYQKVFIALSKCKINVMLLTLC